MIKVFVDGKIVKNRLQPSFERGSTHVCSGIGPCIPYFTSVRNHILGLKILINIRPLSIDGAMLIYAIMMKQR